MTSYELCGSIQLKFTVYFFYGLFLQMDVDKWVQHLTAAKSKAAEKEVPLEKVDGLLNELCLLSTALSMR